MHFEDDIFNACLDTFPWSHCARMPFARKNRAMLGLPLVTGGTKSLLRSRLFHHTPVLCGGSSFLGILYLHKTTG